MELGIGKKVVTKAVEKMTSVKYVSLCPALHFWANGSHQFRYHIHNTLITLITVITYNDPNDTLAPPTCNNDIMFPDDTAPQN